MDFSISGEWDAGLSQAIGQSKTCEYIPLHRHCFGVDWWPYKYTFTAVITSIDPDTGEVEFSHSADVVKVQAAWWRRLGYAVLR
jgi:hypothetical protein